MAKRLNSKPSKQLTTPQPRYRWSAEVGHHHVDTMEPPLKTRREVVGSWLRNDIMRCRMRSVHKYETTQYNATSALRNIKRLETEPQQFKKKKCHRMLQKTPTGDQKFAINCCMPLVSTPNNDIMSIVMASILSSQFQGVEVGCPRIYA